MSSVCRVPAPVCWLPVLWASEHGCARVSVPHTGPSQALRQPPSLHPLSPCEEALSLMGDWSLREAAYRMEPYGFFVLEGGPASGAHIALWITDTLGGITTHLEGQGRTCSC